jgi:thiol:disulfide interchange protein DsbC
MYKILSACLLVILSLTASANPEQIIKAKLNQMMPELSVDSIQKSPVNNLYLVTSGAQVLYMTADAKYLIQGDMYDVQNTAKPVNLSDSVREVHTKEILSKVDPATMIIYPAKPEKTVITVFTDIDCTYCRALHKEVKELNAAGITVRYLAFPRTPKGTASYNKAIHVWCASDRNAALDLAKTGKEPAVANCKHPVDAHHQVAKALGVNVTPVIIMQNGTMIPGYLPAKDLIKVAMENVN